MKKIKLLTARGNKLGVTVTRNGDATDGKDVKRHLTPDVKMHQNYLQVGCLRITKKAAAIISKIFESTEVGTQVQKGNYNTSDPNTCNVVPR